MTEDKDYTLQFPYIILKDTVSVKKTTTLTLTAETDESLKRSGATASTTLAQPRLEMVLPAWGNVVIPTLSGLASCGMTEDTDYKKIYFTVRDKETTAIDTVAVPVLHTAKFGTIVNTDFSYVRLDENAPLTGEKFRTRIFYGFADEAVTSGTLTIQIPADAIVNGIGNETGRLDVKAASNGYTRSGNTFTIPVSHNKGVVFMDLTVTGTGKRVISAALSDGGKTSPLGSCAFDCYTTRLTLPSEYFESRIDTITATIKAKPQTLLLGRS